jgi:hypothetical protein
MPEQTQSQRRAAGRKAAATRKANASRRSAAAARRNAARSASTGIEATQSRVEVVAQQAERAVLVPVGAALIARDGVVEAAKPFRSRAGAERELKRFERRGTTARNAVQREVKRTRTRVERELRQRRRQATQAVKRSRRNLESQVKQARRGVERRSRRFQTDAQDLVKDVQDQVTSLA